MSEIKLINTPLEIGLRTLIILDAISPDVIDLDRLVIYDYLILHTGDVLKCEDSLHPPTPHRSGELFVRRQLIQDGLELMESRELLKKSFEEEGIVYSANTLTGPFLRYFETDYSHKLKSKSNWVKLHFKDYSNNQLKEYIRNNVDRWGGEFVNESFLRREI
ncbi:ABC-three component system middle component 2 [Sporosarcina sp. 179-K 8C2 HS]|uniref:ABC-three component system middle component 2 n=1 Tax=Sporosarcina sp. 179-K 8C2 HS TaxID=3142387 RepID=UPI0039A0452B